VYTGKKLFCSSDRARPTKVLIYLRS